MSLSPAAHDLRLLQYLAPDTFGQLSAQSPPAIESSKAHPQAIDSGYEETDTDPPPHAQPPAATPSIKSEPHSQSSDSTDQDPVVGSSSPFSADVESVDHGYMSDADLPENLFREAQGYDKLSIKEKAVWETKRATQFLQEGESKHFECLDHILGGQPCTTLQEYLPSRLTARSVISSFFGHNKGGWNQIPKSVRVFLCRKCYQRRENKLKPHLAAIQLPLCRELINRLERWRPGCLFTIQLSAAMERKVKTFDVNMDKEGAVRRIVAAEVDTESLEGKASRAANTPVLFAIKLYNRFGGTNKTIENLRSLFDWLDAKLVDGTIEDLPAFEVLLEEFPEDMERMRALKQRRDALKKTLTMRVPIEVAAAPEEIVESEDTPTHRPARAASRKIATAFRKSRVVNATARPVLTGRSAAAKEGDISTKSSALAGPSTRPKIMLKLRVKKPVGASSSIVEAQPRITKKRKRTIGSTSEDGKNKEPSAGPAKKPKYAATKQPAPVEEVADVPTLETGSNGQAQAPEEPHVEDTNGSTHSATFTSSNLEIILDFPPGS